MLTLRAIRKRKADDGQFSFAAVFDMDGRAVEVPVSPVTLLSYDTFQLVVLRATGQLFRHHPATGRDPAGADNYWQVYAGGLLDAPEAQTAAKTPVELN